MCDREIKVVGLGFALLRQDNGLQTTDNGQAAAGNMDLRNYGFTELRKLASLCYAGQQTTDNGQRRAKPAHGSRLKNIAKETK